MALGASTGGTTLFAVLSVLQFNHPAIWLWLIALAGVFLTSGGAALSLIRGNISRDAAEREKRRRLAASLIEDAFDSAIHLMSRRPEETGGIVYLPDPADPDLLVPQFTYNKPGPIEEHLTFGTFVGCTGHAWGMGRQTCADLADVTPEELEQTWKLSPNQIRLTAELKAIISTPIAGPSDPRVLLGVVSIDSQVPHSECGLLSHDSRARALQHAAAVALVLELADLE